MNKIIFFFLFNAIVIYTIESKITYNPYITNDEINDLLQQVLAKHEHETSETKLKELDCAYWLLKNVLEIRKKIAAGKNRGDIPDYEVDEMEESEPQKPTENVPIEIITPSPKPVEEETEPPTEHVPIEIVTPLPTPVDEETEPPAEQVPIEIVTPTPTPVDEETEPPTEHVPIEIVTPTPTPVDEETEPPTEHVPIEIVTHTPTPVEEETEPPTEHVPIEIVTPLPTPVDEETEPPAEQVPIEIVTPTPTPVDEETEPPTEHVPIEIVTPLPTPVDEETEPPTEHVPIEIVTPTPTPVDEETEPPTEHVPIEIVTPTPTPVEEETEPPTEHVPIEIVTHTPTPVEEESEPPTEHVPIEIVTPLPTPVDEETEPPTEHVPVEIVTLTPTPVEEETEPPTEHVPIEIVTPTPTPVEEETEPPTEHVPVKVVPPTPVPSNERKQVTTTSTTPVPVRNNLIQISSIQDIGNCLGSCSISNGCNSIYLTHRNCQKFCQCSNGRPIVMNCPSKLHFNPRLNVCDYPKRAGCPEVKYTIPINNCKTSTKVTTRSPINQGIPIIRASKNLAKPHNYNFKVSVKQDSDYCKGVCPRIDGYNSVYLPHDNCKKFCQCFIGHAVVFDCPGNLHFNTKLNVCDWPQNAGCTEMQNPINRFSEELNINLQPLVVIKDSNSPKYCQGTCNQFIIYSSTYMPNAFCNKFCQCANGRFHVFECPQHLHFNPKFNVCDWPQNAQCTGIGGLGKKWYL